MSFPQLGYPQFLNVPHELYGGERPASAREGGTEGGLGSSSSGGVGSVLGVYGSPWAHGYSAFLPYSGAADLALISQMGSQYELKDGPGSHPASLPVHAAQGFYPYGQYPYGDPARAKTATRETTSTLKAWLQEHQKNPYPTKGEKIMLAIITRMTLTQVSTWFANARRRLKKENKVTWGRSAEDRDGRIFSSDNEEDEPGKHGSDEEEEEEEEEEEIDLETVDIERPEEEAQNPGEEGGEPGEQRTRTRSPEAANKPPPARSPGAEECARPSQSKPKIWSLAETATSPDSARRPHAHARPLGPGIYACQIGKLHNWANAALLNASSILNMRSLLGGHVHAQHAHNAAQQATQHAEQQHAAPAPVARNDARTSGTEEDSDVESTGSFSPKRDDEESDHRPDSLKSSFQLITDRSHHGTASQRVLTSTL